MENSLGRVCIKYVRGRWVYHLVLGMDNAQPLLYKAGECLVVTGTGGMVQSLSAQRDPSKKAELGRQEFSIPT